MTVLKWIFVGLIGLVVFRCATAVNDATEYGGEPAVAEAVAPPPVTAEQREQEARDRLVRAERMFALVGDEELSLPARIAHAQTLVDEFPGTEPAAQAAAALPSLQEALDEVQREAREARERRGQWAYINRTDELTGKPVRIARVTSTNTISLDFPYQGTQHATLEVRDHPQWGRNVYVYIERGQVVCSSYDCTVRVVFDGGRPSTLEGDDAADHSSETVFLPGYSTLTRRMAASKEMRVQVNIFKGGAPTFTFPVKGFNPKLVAP
ncbi:MAG: hypothetical protein ACREPV_01250 [Lysobacter sp.]